jgi:HEAT repeat protein
MGGPNPMRTSYTDKRILLRLTQALESRGWGEASAILDECTQEDIKEISPILVSLCKHSSWLLRADAVETIGVFGLQRHVKSVMALLDDRNVTVRAYALMAYYDLLKEKALHKIKKYCKDSDVRVRVTALSLRCIEAWDIIDFTKLSKILLRSRCDYRHQYAALSIFDYYCTAGPRNEVVDLFQQILSRIDKSMGLATDIIKCLHKWRKKRGHPYRVSVKLKTPSSTETLSSIRKV